MADTEGNEDVIEGSVPGASQNPVLQASNSFEDLSFSIEDDIPARKIRHASGSINEIAEKKQEEDTDGDGEVRTSPITEENEISENSDYAEQIDHMSIEDTDNEVFVSSGKDDEETTRIRSGTMLDKVDSVDREQLDEDVQSAEWKSHKKHIFILSEAGKPIYSRYGAEDRLVTLMGVMQALVSFVQADKNSIRSITAGDHKFIFLVRLPLILVAVSSTQESPQQLIVQLTYVYNQIVSVLTFSQLNRIFQQRRNYDLRRLLTGTEKFIDNLLKLIDTDPSFLLQAVRCLPMSSTVRDIIAQSMHSAKVRDLVFSILISKNQLIALVRMKKYVLHPADLHLIFNLVSASTSFQAAESWTPICLPKFDNSGFLHAHVSYLDDTDACLLLLTVDKELFFTLSDCRQKIFERLRKHGCLQAIRDSLNHDSYKVAQVGISDLRHFLYKSRSTAQFTSPAWEPPYTDLKQRERLFSMYHFLHQRIHCSRPLKILFHATEKETLLGWITSGFELYATFGPLVTKPVAITAINKLLKWIKKEEERFFILNSPVF
ncbi:vacuolar fusion protein MON1 homolog A-like [Ptychodera flava]|uniref:vacuolar fusion protein MON1 homolog A-like n=1 Tax=Ptychodera flava TaxID=63121 RepID=UPI00396A6F0C